MQSTTTKATVTSSITTPTEAVISHTTFAETSSIVEGKLLICSERSIFERIYKQTISPKTVYKHNFLIIILNLK
jgi:hypothetical protein